MTTTYVLVGNKFHIVIGDPRIIRKKFDNLVRSKEWGSAANKPIGIWVPISDLISETKERLEREQI